MRSPLAIRKCSNCGKDVEIFHKVRLQAKDIFCCKDCFHEYRNNHKILNCVCPVCGKKFYVKPYLLKNNKHEHCCSYECMGKYRKQIYKGESNPNYGNRGRGNPLFKGDRIIHCGYYWVYATNHPFAIMDGRIREHRLVAEQFLLTEENSIEIDGVRYLKPEYDVHHINQNKLDNRVENLMVLTRSEHKELHWRLSKNK